MEREYYYNGNVAYSDDGKDGSMITGGDTLEEALSKLFKGALYYVGLDYKVAIRNVQRFCSRCHGAGNVMKTKFRSIKCPMCKGKDSRKILLESIPVELPRGVSVTMK